MTITLDTAKASEERQAAADDAPRMPPRWLPRLRSSRLAVDLYTGFEFALIGLSGLLIAAYHVRGNLGQEDFLGQYFAPLVLVPLIFTVIVRTRQLHDFQALCSVSKTIGRTIASLLGAFGLVIVLGVAAGTADEYSRLWLGFWLVGAIAAVIVARTLASSVLIRAARAGLIRRRTAVFGDRASVERVLREIERSTPEIQVVGTFMRKGYPWNEEHDAAATLRDLVGFGQAQDVDLVIVARDALSDDSLHETFAALSVLPAEVQLYLDFGDGTFPIRGVSSLSSVMLLDVQRRPISGWNRLLKIVEDYAVAVPATILAAPLLLALAIAIKLDSRGPVFFIQRRHGFNHRVIHVWKFRTMHVLEDGDDFVQAVAGDARVTRVGRLLRKTSLDELPQLFNVLRGEMSIVGPRPHPLALNSHYVELLARYGNRHRVKPGITGWAQINGFRGPTEDPYLMQRRVELDLEYIEKWSILMDLKIIALTPFRGLTHPNAL